MPRTAGFSADLAAARAQIASRNGPAIATRMRDVDLLTHYPVQRT